MAKKVAGINLEIGGDTAGLNKALSDTDKQIRKTANELKDVERYLKLDPGNVELLAQKEELLAKQISQTAERAEILEKAQKAADKAIEDGTEISQEQYRKLQREVIATGKNLEELKEKQKVSTEKIDGLMKGMLAGATAAGAGLVAMAAKAGAAADDINTLAKQTGLSTEQIQIFQYASDRIDVSIETLTGSMAKLTKNMESARNGSKNQQQAFDALGVSITDNDGKLRNNQEVMNECINALAAMENETQRDAYAMQIFGKSAQDLNPLILGGSDALKQYGEEAKAAGLILDQETLDAANRFNDSVDKLKATSAGAFAKIGSEVAEQLIPMIEPLAGHIEDFVLWITEHQTELVTAIGAITAALVGFNIVSTIQKGIHAFQEWKTATESVTIAQTLLNAVMAMNPIALIVAAIAGLVAAFVILWNKCEGFRNFWIEAWDKIKSIFFTVVGFIKENWKELTTFLVNPVAGAVALLYKLNPKFKEWVDGLIAKIKGWFSGIKDIGKNLIEGLWNGIGNKVEWLKDKVKGVVDKIKGWFTGKDGFDTHSPSKWSEKIGNFLMEGLAIGITEDMSVEEALKKKVDNLKSFISNELGITDSDIKLADAEYNLWELKNPEATDEDKNNKQISLLMKKIQAQSEAVRIANDALWESKQLTGENSAESREYQLQLINERIELEKLTAEMQEILSLRQKMYTYNITDSVNQLKTSINAISYMRMNNTARAIGMKEGQTVNVTQNYYGYKGTIAENNAAMKKTIRNMEVSLA